MNDLKPVRAADRLSCFCEQGIVLLLVGMLLFGPLAFGAVRIQEFLVLQGLAAVVAVLGAVCLCLRHGEVSWPPAAWGVVAFCIYALVRCRQAEVEYVGRLEWLRILVYALVVFASSQWLRKGKNAVILIAALGLLAAALSAFGVYQFITQYDRVWHFIKPAVYLKRASGTYMNPNLFSGFLEMVVPLTLAFVFQGRLSHVWRIVLAYASLAALAGIVVANSRGGWVAIIVALGVFFAMQLFRWRKHWRLALALVLFLGIGVGALVSLVRSNSAPPLRLEDSFRGGQMIDARRFIWATAYAMWRDHFWTGVGPGHFDVRYAEYRAAEVPLQMRALYVHNDYLNALTDWGLVGALLIAGTLAIAFLDVLLKRRKLQRTAAEDPSNRGALAVGAACGVIAILVHSLVDFNLQAPANALLFVTCLGLLSGCTGGKERRQPATWSTTLLGTALLLAVAGGLSWQTIRLGRETVWRNRATVAKRQQDLTMARNCLEQAFTIEPSNFNTAYELGEILRTQSFAGDSDYAALAEQAVTWYRRAAALNAHDGLCFARLGMCLDWLGRKDEAGGAFAEANRLDPNGYLVLALQGWHRVQTGQYAEAKEWLEKSLKMKWARDNPIAGNYLQIVKRKLAEDAARQKSGAAR